MGNHFKRKYKINDEVIWCTLISPIVFYESEVWGIDCNDIKWNENKAFWGKKIKSLLEQIGLGEFWMKAHYADIGIVNMTRQRLKDIALQRWLSETEITTPEKMLTKAAKWEPTGDSKR